MAGCLFCNNAGGDETTALTFAPVTPSIGDPFSFWVLVTANSPGSTPTDDMNVKMNTGTDEISHLFECDGILDYDSGWIRVYGEVTATTDITALTISAVAISGGVDVYIDNVYFLESEGTSFVFTRSAGGVPGAVAV